MTLSIAFPSLYTLTVIKEALVSYFQESSREIGGWLPRFSRSFNDWELEEIQNLLLVLHAKRVFPN